jgi:hypothetical protein
MAKSRIAFLALSGVLNRSVLQVESREQASVYTDVMIPREMTINHLSSMSRHVPVTQSE